MLQIKNTLGGGKSEGLYVWKKNNYAFTEKSTSGMTANTFITTEAQNKSIKYYYSSSYSHDNNTGLFVLENPTSGTVPYDAGISPPANVYVTVFSPSSEIMIKTSSTSGKSTLYNVSSGVYFHIANANYPYTLFESERILSFIDYVVSDKETAYPDGGEKGGYWYEKVAEFDLSALGFTKYAIDEYVPTSDQSFTTIAGNTVGHKFSHSLGEVPKYAIVWCPSLMESDFYGSKDYLASAEMAIADPSAGDSNTKGYTTFMKTGNSSSSLKVGYSNGALGANFKSDYIYVQLGSSYPHLKSGETYYIITLA